MIAQPWKEPDTDGEMYVQLTLEPGQPTQVAHPWRAVLRTFVAALVALPVAWLARIGIDLTGLAPAMVDSLTTAAYPLVTGFGTWILARPRVNAWIERYVPVFATGVHTERALPAPDRH